MKSILCFVLFSLISVIAWGASGALCAYEMKDYDSPGFGIPYRSNIFIKARFGCVYRCACPNSERSSRVTHVLEEKHLDLNIFSDQTGGASRAKWFLCPHSVKEDSWTPYRDELGRIIAYNVEPDYSPFPAENLQSPQVNQWLSSCQSE